MTPSSILSNEKVSHTTRWSILRMFSRFYLGTNKVFRYTFSSEVLRKVGRLGVVDSAKELPSGSKGRMARQTLNLFILIIVTAFKWIIWFKMSACLCSTLQRRFLAAIVCIVSEEYNHSIPIAWVPLDNTGATAILHLLYGFRCWVILNYCFYCLCREFHVCHLLWSIERCWIYHG